MLHVGNVFDAARALDCLKQDLEETSLFTVTVIRSDLEILIESYEYLQKLLAEKDGMNK